MVDTKVEAEIQRKADKGICYVKGCDKPGMSRVQITYAKKDPATGQLRQVIVNAWACQDTAHRGGR